MTFLVAASRKMIMVNGVMLITKRTREKIGNQNSLILKWKVFMPKILSLVRIEANFLDYFLMNLRMQ